MTALRIIGNWKMHGDAGRLAAFARAPLTPPGVAVGLAVPATLIAPAAARLPGVAIGGQDCHAAREGAHTGDLSAAMLADAGARFVILGHSERRRDHGEDDATVAAKARAALNAGLTAIVCVGERQRDPATLGAFLSAQVAGSLPRGERGSLVIAYEPVWAIGSGAQPDGAAIAAAAAIVARAVPGSDWRGAPPPVLYGGSVDPGTAPALLGVPGIAGLLVGGASLDPAAFAAIVAVAAPLSDAPRRPSGDIVSLGIDR